MRLSAAAAASAPAALRRSAQRSAARASPAPLPPRAHPQRTRLPAAAAAAACRLRCAAPCSRVRAASLLQFRSAATATPDAPSCDDDGRPLSDVDAIIVLAGGLTADGGLPPWVEARLDAAAAVSAALRVPILCSGGGTPHRPPHLPAGGGGHVLHEGAACCAYLQKAHGVPSSRLLKEQASYDTVGNAWFSVTTHALPAGWRAPLVITSAFHMPRSRACFEWVLSLQPYDAAGAVPRFLSSPDRGMAADVAAARLARERESLATLQRNAAEVRTAPQFHAWLNGTHMCYAVARQGEWGAAPAMADKALASY